MPGVIVITVALRESDIAYARELADAVKNAIAKDKIEAAVEVRSFQLPGRADDTRAAGG